MRRRGDHFQLGEGVTGFELCQTVAESRWGYYRCDGVKTATSLWRGPSKWVKYNFKDRVYPRTTRRAVPEQERGGELRGQIRAGRGDN
jgi:hypothetical protein